MALNLTPITDAEEEPNTQGVGTSSQPKDKKSKPPRTRTLSKRLRDRLGRTPIELHTTPELPERSGPGAPTVYRKTFPELARRLYLLGITDEEVAGFFGVTVTVLHDWDKLHPEFADARARGKLPADGEVAERLYLRALGYSHEAVKVFMPPGKKRKPIYAPYIEHYPPDTQAAIWWLKNRRPDLWKDRTETTATIVGEIVHTTPEERRARIAQLEQELGVKGLVIDGEVVKDPGGDK